MFSRNMFRPMWNAKHIILKFIYLLLARNKTKHNRKLYEIFKVCDVYSEELTQKKENHSSAALGQGRTTIASAR